MSSSKTRATIPRGFSRFYVLHLLKEKGPMTGKMIMDEAEKRTDGVWRPSAGLIYPLLGRLLATGLIEETEDGKYRITSKGEGVLTQYAKVQDEIDRRLDTVMKLGLTGKLLVENVLDRITGLATQLQEDIVELSSETRRSFIQKYKSFLKAELKRLEPEST